MVVGRASTELNTLHRSRTWWPLWLGLGCLLLQGRKNILRAWSALLHELAGAGASAIEMGIVRVHLTKLLP